MAQNTKKSQTGVLVEAVKRGDSAAFEVLLEMYTPLIESLVAARLESELYSLYADDFKQEARMVFYNSILAYDTEQFEVEFGLYAKICITNALVTQFRTLKKRESEMLSGVFEGEWFASHAEDEPSVRFLDEERLKKLYSVIRENLSEFEYNVWWLHVYGMTSPKIAERLGRDRKSVENAICRIRKKLRALLKNHE